MMLTAGSISLSDSLVDFFNQTGFAGDLGEYSDDSRRFPILYLAIKHKFRTAAALHDRFRYAADQPAGSEYVPFRTVRRRTYPLGKASFRMPDCSIIFIWVWVPRYLPVSDLHRCRCHDRFRPADRQPESFMLSAAAVGYFRDLPGGLRVGLHSCSRPVVSIISGADGPTAIFLTARLAPELLGPIAVAPLTLIWPSCPVIQPSSCVC